MTTDDKTPVEDVLAALRARFPDASFEAKPLLLKNEVPGDQWFVRVEPTILLDVMRFLRDDPALAFEQLADLTCVDYLDFPDATDRYGVVYTLLSITQSISRRPTPLPTAMLLSVIISHLVSTNR